MNDLVIHNARLYPMSHNCECSTANQIAVLDGKISEISDQNQTGLLPAKEYFDADGACVLPGLIDCHTHIIFSGERSQEHILRITGSSYADIHAAGGGIHSSVRAVNRASVDDLITQSLPRIKNLQTEGVTTLEIKSGYGLNLENEIKMLKAIRKVGKHLALNVVSTFLGAHTVPKEQTEQEYIDNIINKMLPSIAAQDLADAVDIYVEHLAFSKKSMQKLFTAAKKYNLKTRVHAEQLSNQKAAEFASELGALSADHLEYLDESGAMAMAKANTVAVLLPSAFYFLQETKKPPIEILRKNQVVMAVATDTNPGTSPIPSILTALHLSVHLFNLKPEEALMGITINAAKALGLDSLCGSLEIGKQADITLWDISNPEFLCYQLGGIKPKNVWFKGKSTIA